MAPTKLMENSTILLEIELFRELKSISLLTTQELSKDQFSLKKIYTFCTNLFQLSINFIDFCQILMSGSRTVDQITSQLEQEDKVMYIHEKNGNYADAEKCRLKIEQLKKDLESRTLLQMGWRHKRQTSQLEKANHDELQEFNNLMDKKMNDIIQEGEKAENELNIKHRQELEAERREQEAELSTKLKESSELLNLRTMEQFMVKQKKFDEADKVQKKIFDLQKIEKKSWMDKRDERIQVALNTLKAKHNVETANLKKRYKTLLDELLTERKIEQDRLSKKHENFHKDLKSQQEKQILNYKGQFRSKGGRDSPQRTKSSFTS